MPFIMWSGAAVLKEGERLPTNQPPPTTHCLSVLDLSMLLHIIIIPVVVVFVVLDHLERDRTQTFIPVLLQQRKLIRLCCVWTGHHPLLLSAGTSRRRRSGTINEWIYC